MEQDPQKYWKFCETVYIKKCSLVNLKLTLPQIKDREKKSGTLLLCGMLCHLRGEPSIRREDIFNPQQHLMVAKQIPQRSERREKRKSGILAN